LTITTVYTEKLTVPPFGVTVDHGEHSVMLHSVTIA
jgi:hypothetical protein